MREKESPVSGGRPVRAVYMERRGSAALQDQQDLKVQRVHKDLQGLRGLEGQEGCKDLQARKDSKSLQAQ